MAALRAALLCWRYCCLGLGYFRSSFPRQCFRQQCSSRRLLSRGSQPCQWIRGWLKPAERRCSGLALTRPEMHRWNPPHSRLSRRDSAAMTQRLPHFPRRSHARR